MLIFDCDGTLVDSEHIANDVFIEAVQTLGIPLTHDEAWANFPGTSMAHCMRYVEETYKVRLPSDFVGRQRILQKEAFKEHLKPIKGVIAALEQLTPYAKCVASNGPLPIMKANLATTKIDRFFNGRLFSAYVLGVWKPEPDLFIHAAEQMGFLPSNCIVIEDSAAGIKAGLGANMNVLAYQSPDSQYDHHQMEGATYFDNMDQLRTLIKSL